MKKIIMITIITFTLISCWYNCKTDECYIKSLEIQKEKEIEIAKYKSQTPIYNNHLNDSELKRMQSEQCVKLWLIPNKS